jgi:hypothetical protein
MLLIVLISIIVNAGFTHAFVVDDNLDVVPLWIEQLNDSNFAVEHIDLLNSREEL